MFSPIEEIKSRLDIVELVQGYVRLQKSGANFKAICPFHSEKTPSFYVTPSRQIWHCFGCSKGGDIFKFIMEIEGHDFSEALRLLSTRAGVTLKREDPMIRSERNLLYDICEAAAKIFERTLLLTAPAKEYLKKRGVMEATVRFFRIGFAPESWDFLINTLTKKGFKKEDLEKAGLAARSQDNTSWYDRFRNRIMFPIADSNGRIIGFGGRNFALPAKTSVKAGNEPSSANVADGIAKYVNTPATLIYDKSKVLYGFDKAKQEIRRKNEVVIVEGYMDCVMSHQAGVVNTVAVSGTALTIPQLKMLRRLAGAIISSFDTDTAGDSATKRSLTLASQFEFTRKIAEIPSGKDPADAVLENPAEWLRAVAEAKDVVAFYFNKAFRDWSVERAEGKKAIAGLVLPYIAELADEIEKAHWIGELARRLETPEEAIWKELRKKIQSRDTEYRTATEEKKEIPSRKELLEERFLSLFSIICEQKMQSGYDHSHVAFISSLHGDIFQILNGIFVGEPTQTHRATLETLKFKGEIIKNTVDDVCKEFIRSGRELEKMSLKEELIRVGGEIEKQEREGSHERVEPLLKRFSELSSSLNSLK